LFLQAHILFAIEYNNCIIIADANKERRATMAISQELLDILACPKCKGDIYLNDTEDGLICNKCKLLYEIKDDIPIMLIDEAKPIEA
jgi:hypothetical protein